VLCQCEQAKRKRGREAADIKTHKERDIADIDRDAEQAQM